MLLPFAVCFKLPSFQLQTARFNLLVQAVGSLRAENMSPEDRSLAGVTPTARAPCWPLGLLHFRAHGLPVRHVLEPGASAHLAPFEAKGPYGLMLPWGGALWLFPWAEPLSPQGRTSGPLPLQKA